VRTQLAERGVPVFAEDVNRFVPPLPVTNRPVTALRVVVLLTWTVFFAIL
jgi:hypothetical protein